MSKLGVFKEREFLYVSEQLVPNQNKVMELVILREISRGGGGGVPLRGEKTRFWFLLGHSASKGPQREL